MHERPHYKRILLKLSGEALMGSQKYGVDPAACQKIAHEVSQITQLGVQVALVIGGGNICRGAKQASLPRTPADQMGMLATLINGLALQHAFEAAGTPCHLLSAIECGGFAEPYTWKKALLYLESRHIVLFACGTGNPYFTTDSAAALRALEIGAEILLKGTKVDGIYDKDPVKHPNAVKFDKITYSQVLTQKLAVMDATAIALCRENHLPIRVIDIFSDHTLKKAIYNQPVGTLVEETP